MTSAEHVSDTDLHTYLDGELDRDASIEIEQWLAGHPEDAARYHTFKLQMAQLHQLYENDLETPIPAGVLSLLDEEQRESKWIPGWKRMAAAIVLLLVGGVSGWGASGYFIDERNIGQTFVKRALNAHVVYAHDVDRPVERGFSGQPQLVSWLSERLGRTLRTPNLAGAGFNLIGGRLLVDQDKPAALFMYEDQSKRRVSLYVRPGMEGGSTKFRFIAEHGMVAFYWTDGQLTYALTGEMPRGDLLDLAQMVFNDIVSAHKEG